MAIPDNGAAVTSTVDVTGRTGNAPAALKVDVDIRHTWRGDVVVDLLAPDGTAYRLKNSSGNDSADNVIAAYTVNASTEPRTAPGTPRPGRGLAGHGPHQQLEADLLAFRAAADRARVRVRVRVRVARRRTRSRKVSRDRSALRSCGWSGARLFLMSGIRAEQLGARRPRRGRWRQRLMAAHQRVGVLQAEEPLGRRARRRVHRAVPVPRLAAEPAERRPYREDVRVPQPEHRPGLVKEALQGGDGRRRLPASPWNQANRGVSPPSGGGRRRAPAAGRPRGR
ncbi:hypothetical protein SALBM135S_02286 [Streptomyces alboniger]